MNKKVKILALIMAMVMLLCAAPISAFAMYADENTSLLSEESDISVLDELCAASSGCAYSGIAIPSGAVILEDSKSAKGPDGSQECWVSSADSDGSFILTDTRNDITSDDAMKTDITFSYTDEHLLPIGEENTRFIVTSVNLTAGEALNCDFMRVGAKIRKTVTVYSQDGICLGITEDKSDTKETTENITVFSYDEATGCILLCAGSYDAADTDESMVLASFNTSIYTNFSIITDTEENKAYYYLNGIYVGMKTDLFPQISDEPIEVINSDGNKSVTAYEFSSYGVSAYFGTSNPISGMFLKSGSVKSYRTDDVGAVFSEDGKFIYENASPANGVFKLGDSYYLFENGFVVCGKSVSLEGYSLELSERSGKILNCALEERPAYRSLTAEELTNKGAVGVLDDLLGEAFDKTSFTSTDGTDKLTAYRYASDGTTVEAYEIDAVKSFKYEEGTFTVGFKSYVSSTPSSYYASEEDLLNNVKTSFATSDKTLNYIYAKPDTALSSDFVFSFDVKFGEGVNTIKKSGNDTTSMPLFRLLCKNTSNKDLPISLAEIRYDDLGEPHIYFYGKDCGACRIGEFVNYTVAAKLNDNILDISVYVNGELRATVYELSYSVKSVTYLGINSTSAYSWDGEIVTLKPAAVYSGSTNFSAVTDDYTGFADDGDGGLIWYENGSVAKIGTYEEVESLAGKKYAELIGYNTVLTDIIHLNFIVRLGTLASEEGAYALLTLGSKTQEVPLCELEQTADGAYKIMAKLSSVQLGKEIGLEIFDSNGNKVQILKDNLSSEIWHYSVKRYAEYMIKNSDLYSEKEVELVKALLLYGAFAERNFLSKKGLETASALTNFERLALQNASIGKLYTDISFEGGSLSYEVITENVDLTATAKHPALLGVASLNLDSSITIRIELKTETEPLVISGGSVYTEMSDRKQKYYVEISGIKAATIGNVYTVTVDDNEINVSTLAVANAVLCSAENTKYSDEFCDLMRALYVYYHYAHEYACS